MKFRILVVEDNMPAARLVRIFLARMGFESDHVSSGEQAVARVQDEEYDAVLMDLRLDGLGGIEASRLIRARERQERLPRLPILGMSAQDASLQAGPCLAAGMDGYLAKPFPLDLFKEVLESLLHARLRLAA